MRKSLILFPYIDFNSSSLRGMCIFIKFRQKVTETVHRQTTV